MSDASPDPIAFLKGLAQSATRIRLAPGVLGKTHTVILSIIGMWVLVLYRLSPTAWAFNGALVFVALLTTGVGVGWCWQARVFAKANPALALMEGADITEYQRFEAEAKELRTRRSTLIADPTKPEQPQTPPSGPHENA